MIENSKGLKTCHACTADADCEFHTVTNKSDFLKLFNHSYCEKHNQWYCDYCVYCGDPRPQYIPTTSSTTKSLRTLNVKENIYNAIVTIISIVVVFLSTLGFVSLVLWDL